MDRYISASDITPDDDGNHPFKAIYVGGAGNLAVELVEGGEVTLTGVTAGTIYPIHTATVKATGTTATDLVGLN